MPSTEEQLKLVLAESCGRVHKSVMARTLGISMGYLDTIGSALKRKEEVAVSGGWYALAGDGQAARKENITSLKKRGRSVAAYNTLVSVIRNHKIPIAVIIILVLFLTLFGANIARTAKSSLRDTYRDGNVAEASSSNDAPSYQDSKSDILTNDFHFTVPITTQIKLPRAEGRERAIEKPKQVLKMNVAVTFYSSTPEETDDTPFVTANGTVARDGIAASNFLAFGTRIKLPELFGDKHFIIEDRMHSRFTDRIDVWVPTRKEALNQGISFTTVEVY